MKHSLIAFTLFLFLPGFSFAQHFVPSSVVGGANNDIVNDPPESNVGIGLFHNYPDPIDKLTVGGDISLYPDGSNQERKIMGRSKDGLLSINTMLVNWMVQ